MQAVHLKSCCRQSPRTLSFLAGAQAPARVTSAVMTPTLSSGTCPRLHILPLPLAPDSRRDLLPAPASFRPPLREAERRGHALCSKPFRSPHCSSGGITPHPASAPTHRPPPRAPTQLAALTSSTALTHQPHPSPPQPCHSCNPLPRRFGPKIFTSPSLITWGSVGSHPLCSAGGGGDEFVIPKRGAGGSAGDRTPCTLALTLKPERLTEGGRFYSKAATVFTFKNSLSAGAEHF